jgi:putative transposase
VSLRRVSQVLGWIGVERSHVAIWTWVQKFGQRLEETDRRPAADLPAVVLMDETVIKQRGEEFMLFAAVDPETRHLLHASIAPSRNYLTTRRFLEELRELYGRVPPIIVTDGATYGPVFERLGVTHIIRRHSVRNRIERRIQELKRRIDTFYASFTGQSVDTTNNWLRQFAWVWNACLS